MVKNKKFYELESKLVPLGYDCYNRDDNSITFVLNKHCVPARGTVVDSGDSLSLTVEETSSLEDIKTKTSFSTSANGMEKSLDRWVDSMQVAKSALVVVLTIRI